jgi:murein tripeptide amidase MpaA
LSGWQAALRYFVAVCLILFLPFIGATAQERKWMTFYEQSGFIKTPRYEGTIRFVQSLDSASRQVNYSTFGFSPQGRELPVLVLDANGEKDLQKIARASKAVVLVQACIHAGESDGKDAGLMLIRDMVIHGKHTNILDSLTLLFVPIFNVDGHEMFGKYNRINQNGPEEMGWRATSQRLNLNRDYLKAEAPEMQAMIQLYQAVRPDFYIDCHTTDGADYIYPLTYGLQLQGNLTEAQSRWLSDVYLTFVSGKMEADDKPIAPYFDFIEWHNPKKGFRAYYESPRYSGGYAAINNRPALLIETHMLKPYKTRVDATYQMLLNSLQIIAQSSNRLKLINRNADREATRMHADKRYVLTYKTAKKPGKFDYRGYEYSIERSDLTGGDWYRYSSEPLDMAIDYYQMEAGTTIALPDAYIIPPQWTQVVDKLRLHNVEVQEMMQDTTLEVGIYSFDGVQWQNRPFEGKIRLSYQVREELQMKTYPSGSFVVPLNQVRSQLAIHLLEPEAPDALVRWGFMNTIFEQKEYAESYVMEEKARQMLVEDEHLRTEFNEKIETDSAFATNPWAVLNWFYQRSPYGDGALSKYPIGRVFRNSPEK